MKNIYFGNSRSDCDEWKQCFAQNNQPEKKKLTPEQRIELQAKHIEQRLMLDENTSAKFIPLYKEYLQALQSCRQTLQKDGQKVN